MAEAAAASAEAATAGAAVTSAAAIETRPAIDWKPTTKKRKRQESLLEKLQQSCPSKVSLIDSVLSLQPDENDEGDSSLNGSTSSSHSHLEKSESSNSNDDGSSSSSVQEGEAADEDEDDNIGAESSGVEGDLSSSSRESLSVNATAAQSSKSDVSDSLDPYLNHFHVPMTWTDTQLKDRVARASTLLRPSSAVPLVHTGGARCLLLHSADADPVPDAWDSTLDHKQLLASRGFIKKRLIETVLTPVKQLGLDESRRRRRPFPCSWLQQQLLRLSTDYADLLFCARSPSNADEVRRFFCLRALNHVMTGKDKVLRNNAKLSHKAKLSQSQQSQAKPAHDQLKTSLSVKDQGFTRPKILILVPFRNAAYRVVSTLLSMLPPQQTAAGVSNKTRFEEEYGWTEGERPGFDSKPADFQECFSGNIDDCFRIGMAFGRQTVKLYAEFYSCDVIVASPLGLRLSMAEGNIENKYSDDSTGARRGAPDAGGRGKNRGGRRQGHQKPADEDCDFLSSIEMLIVDQADVLQMQNWEHVQTVVRSLNQLPKQDHNIDFSRVRPWYLTGNARYLRQSLVFSSVLTPEIHALFNKDCHSLVDKRKVIAENGGGSISRLTQDVRQLFYRIDCTDGVQADDRRFQFFVAELFPAIQQGLVPGLVIVAPSYFDFVRLRNLFRSKELEFAGISEYSDGRAVGRARSLLSKGQLPLLLITERWHFFRRYRLRNVKGVVFYAPPMFPDTYSDILNAAVSSVSSALLYTPLDQLAVARVVGDERCSQMMTDEKSIHIFC